MKRFWISLTLVAAMLFAPPAFGQRSYGSGSPKASIPPKASPTPKTAPTPKAAPTPKSSPVPKATPIPKAAPTAPTARSYGSGSGSSSPSITKASPTPAPMPPKSYGSGSGTPSISPSAGIKPLSSGIDSSAGRAQKEDASAKAYSSSQKPKPAPSAPTPSYSTPSYSSSGSGPSYSSNSGSRTTNNTTVIIDRRPYYGNRYDYYTSRPVVRYNDPFDSIFWYYLLDQPTDVQALWAYNHRNDMDAARYNALLAQNAALSAQISALEAQNMARNTSYAPPEFDPNVMYASNPSPGYTQAPAPAYAPSAPMDGRAVFHVFLWIFFIALGAIAVWYIFLREVR